MAVFVIADLHLSTDASTNKSMEVFGHRWAGYTSRLEENWRKLIRDMDTVIVPGDVSWALSLEEAREDMRFLSSLPGRKILGKGNHDFWWSTMRKLDALLSEEKIESISFLFNNAIELDEFIIAGSRGWFPEDGLGSLQNEVDFDKITNREVGRLRLSLEDARAKQEASGKEIVVFMHFPVVWADKANEPFVELLHEYNIRRVYFGHIHSVYNCPAVIEYENIRFELISADYLSFVPKYIAPFDEI